MRPRPIRFAVMSALVVPPLVLLLALSPGAALASLEQFDFWDLGAEEADDEYGLDAYFTSFSPEWNRRFRRAETGARTSLGCVTRERWEMLAQVHIHRDLGTRARFAYDYYEEDRLSIVDLQHRFGFEVALGGTWVGGFARPRAAKELHDFGLTLRRDWPAGYRAAVAISYENALNNFWTERSFVIERVRIDHLNRARELSFGGGRRWSERRAILLGIDVLPELRRTITPPPSTGEAAIRRTVDGSDILLRGELDITPRTQLDCRLRRKQSRVAETEAAPGAADQASAIPFDLRRLAWSARAELVHPLPAPWQAAWMLGLRRNREEDAASGPDPYRLRVLDVNGAVGITHPLFSWLTANAGYAFSSVNVEQSGPIERRRFTHGTRGEQRIYLAANFAFRGVRVRLVETLELDGESYDVVGVHDKSFIQIQGAF